MRKTIFTALIIISGFSLFGQNSSQFNSDCNTDFWTINVDGYIQQWSLSNGTISGGDTILSGGGTSLSYCGDSNAPTFFSNSYTQVGITYYNPDSGWINIPTYNVVNNNGGHLDDQYYMVEGGFIQIVKYWDGVNLLTVDSLHVHGEFFAGTQDIAVDTLGQAWVFTGHAPSTVDSLKVYNQNGKINSYSIQFNKIAYGSFFLNDTLYLGTYQDSIFSVIISGNTAQLGNPIPFPCSSFTDMASCQKTESIISITEYLNTKIIIFPNPTSKSINIQLGRIDQQIEIFNSQGQFVYREELNITTDYKSKEIDLSHLPKALYLIKVTGENSIRVGKVLKN